MTSLAPMKYASAKDYHCPDLTKAKCNETRKTCHVTVDGIKWSGSLPNDKKEVDLYTIDLSSKDPDFPGTTAWCNFKTSKDMLGDYDFVTTISIPEEDCTVNGATEGLMVGSKVKYTCDNKGDLKGCIISCQETKN